MAATPGASSSLSDKYDRMRAIADAAEADDEAATMTATGGRAPIKLEQSAEAEKYEPVDGPLLLNASEIGAASKLSQSGKDSARVEIWQIVCTRLRCWVPSRSGSKGPTGQSLARPYVILAISLFPAGRVISHTIPSPPDEQPSPARLAQFIFQAMLSPPKHAGITPHRPVQVVFPEQAHAAVLHNTLAAMGVGCGMLSTPPDLGMHLDKMAQSMCKQGFATMGPAGGRKSMLSVESVRPPHLRAFAEAAGWLRRFRPWRPLPDRLTLRVRILGKEKPMNPDASASEAGWQLLTRFWGPNEAGGAGAVAAAVAAADGAADSAAGAGAATAESTSASKPASADGKTADLPRSFAAPAMAWHEGLKGVKHRGAWRDGLSGTSKLQSKGVSAPHEWSDAESADLYGADIVTGGSVEATVMRGPFWFAPLGHTNERAAWKQQADKATAKDGPGTKAVASGAGKAVASGAGKAVASGAAADDEDEDEDGGEGVTLGVAMFKSRWDAEQRTMSTVDSSQDALAIAVGNPVDLRCAWCGRVQGQPDLLAIDGSDAADGTQEPATVTLRRCGRSHSAYYCSNTNCQKNDWTRGRFRQRCLARSKRSLGKQRWGDGEIATVFVPPLAAPVNDVADCEAVTGWPLDEPVPPPGLMINPADGSVITMADGSASMSKAHVAGYLRPEFPSVADSSFPMPLVFGDTPGGGMPRRPSEAELTTMTVAMHVLPRWVMAWPALAASAKPSARETLIVLRSDPSLPPIPAKAVPPTVTKSHAPPPGHEYVGYESEAAALVAVEACPQIAVRQGTVEEPAEGISLSVDQLCASLSLPLPPSLPPWLEGLVVAVRLDPMLTQAEANAASTS